MPELRMPSQSGWQPTPQEEWIWELLCAGEIADFNEVEDYGGELDPKMPEDWPETRIIRPGFLKAILGEENYRSALTHQGVRIVGAWFKEPLDLSHMRLSHPLWLEHCCFEKHMDLGWVEASQSLSLEGSTLEKVDLAGARIGGFVDMRGSTFSDTLNMNSIHVEQDLFMREKATFKKVDLVGARIGGTLSMIGSTFSDTLDMDSIHVEQDLFMREKATFKKVDLAGARIGGFVDMRGSTFGDSLTMDEIDIGNNLWMKGCGVAGKVDIISARIGDDLNLERTTLSSLNLTNTEIIGEFSLGSAPDLGPNWQGGGQLILLNTKVGALQDQASEKDVPNAWPSALELDGFTYGRLGGFAAIETERMASRKLVWFKTWLGRQTQYSPQPYEQLAGVLLEAGYRDKATTILYEGKKDQHREIGRTLLGTWREGSLGELFRTCLTWLWLALQWLFIGYGYRNFRVIFWVLFFWGLGLLLLHLSGQYAVHKSELDHWGLAYSLDMLLPVIELHKPHYNKIELVGWVRIYFYAQKILGYVLASFLIAGLSGLTRRSAET